MSGGQSDLYRIGIAVPWLIELCSTIKRPRTLVVGVIDDVCLKGNKMQATRSESPTTRFGFVNCLDAVRRVRKYNSSVPFQLLMTPSYVRT